MGRERWRGRGEGVMEREKGGSDGEGEEGSEWGVGERE